LSQEGKLEGGGNPNGRREELHGVGRKGGIPRYEISGTAWACVLEGQVGPGTGELASKEARPAKGKKKGACPCLDEHDRVLLRHAEKMINDIRTGKKGNRKKGEMGK